jgi:hypothetical protein
MHLRRGLRPLPDSRFGRNRETGNPRFAANREIGDAPLCESGSRRFAGPGISWSGRARPGPGAARPVPGSHWRAQPQTAAWASAPLCPLGPRLGDCAGVGLGHSNSPCRRPNLAAEAPEAHCLGAGHWHHRAVCQWPCHGSGGFDCDHSIRLVANLKRRHDVCERQHIDRNRRSGGVGEPHWRIWPRP